MDIREIRIEQLAEPAKIKLIRGAKGTYQWEISLSGESLVAVSQKICEMDKVLIGAYKQTGE